jgi:hypothetical protein
MIHLICSDAYFYGLRFTQNTIATTYKTGGILMKLLLVLFTVLCFQIATFAQLSSFEGYIDYQVEIKSKSTFMSDESLKIIMGQGSALRVYIKKGKYYRVSGALEQYVGFAPKLDYIKYKGRDTVYSVPDTTYHPEKIQIKRNDKTSMIAGYSCKGISIIQEKETSEFLYAPDLVQSPDITGTEFHRFVEETKSVWLKCISENSAFVATYTAIRVQRQTIDEKLMQLPSLPAAPFVIEHMIKAAELKSEKDWNAYISRSVNADLANKYLKIPKGEKSVKQTVLVEYVITRFGTIGEVRVANAKEVHPALAKEAVRVIKEGYGWKPATFNGQAIEGWAKQPITFFSSY